MTAERDADREAILARRALFLASTLGGLSLATTREAGAAEGTAPGASSATPPTSSSAPAGSAAPADSSGGRGRGAMICLSDDPIDTEDENRQRRIPARKVESYLAVCLSVMVPSHYQAARNHPPLLGLHARLPSFALAPVQIDGKRERGVLLGVGLDAMVGVNVAGALDARLHLGVSYADGAGGVLQSGAIAALLYNPTPTLWTSVGAGGGYLWPTRSPGRLELRPGPFAQVEIRPIGVRFGRNEHLELGPRLGLTWAHQRADEGERFGFAGVSFGFDFTYLFGASSE